MVLVVTVIEVCKMIEMLANTEGGHYLRLEDFDSRCGKLPPSTFKDGGTK